MTDWEDNDEGRFDREAICRCVHCGAETHEDFTIDCPVCEEAMCVECQREGRGCELEPGGEDE